MMVQSFFILYAHRIPQQLQQHKLLMDESAFDADADQIAEVRQDVRRFIIFDIKPVADDLFPQALFCLDAAADVHHHLIAFPQQGAQGPAHIPQTVFVQLLILLQQLQRFIYDRKYL